MVVTWPRSIDRRAARQVVRGVGEHLVDVGGDGAEVAALRRRIDVDHRAHVVMRDDGVARARRRWSPGRRAAGSVPPALSGRLRRSPMVSMSYCGVCIDDRVGHAVRRIRASRSARSGCCRPACRACWSPRRSRSARPCSPASGRRSTFRVGSWKACWMRASATPGIAADPGQQLVGIGPLGRRDRCRRSACRSATGTPKLRIWVTMSAGRKEKVMPGTAPAAFRAACG